FGCCTVAAGRMMVNAAPSPGQRPALRLPPCSSMMRLEMLSPRPVPVDLVLAKGVNRRSAISCGTPGPVSSTASCTLSLLEAVNFAMDDFQVIGAEGFAVV